MKKIQAVAIAVLMIFLSGCAGTRATGALGGGSHAAIWDISVNYQRAWTALLDVLKDDPTLFQVDQSSVRKPTDSEEGIVQGKKGNYLITIWLVPQGKDNTRIEIQAAWGIFTDGPTQASLGMAIVNQMEKKLQARDTIPPKSQK